MFINEAEFKKHYPQLSIPRKNKISGARLLSLIDITYLGLNLKLHMGLILGEIGQFAQEDPMQIEKVILDIEAEATTLLESQKLEELLTILKQFRDYVIPFVSDTERKQPINWTPANNMATSIESRIERIEYGLKGKELATFNIGRILAKWSELEANDNKISKKGEKKLLGFIKEVSPKKVVPAEIIQILNKYRKFDDIPTIHAYHEIYNLIRSMILMQEIATD